jgi:hypothetical protein
VCCLSGIAHGAEPVVIAAKSFVLSGIASAKEYTDTSVANYLPLTGGTMTGGVADGRGADGRYARSDQKVCG